MNRKYQSLVLMAAMAAPVLALAQAQQQEQPRQPQQQPQQAQQRQQEQPRNVMVEEEVIVRLVEEPTYAMHRAREAFLRHEYRQAASDLDAAAAFLRLEAVRADPHVGRPATTDARTSWANDAADDAAHG